MQPTYKVEMKGSLFEVTLENGCYSDWNIKHYIFSGNTEAEVWELVKIWAKSGGTGDNYNYGLIYGTERFQFSNLPDYKGRTEMTENDWCTDYGSAYLVKISHANVIYVTPV